MAKSSTLSVGIVGLGQIAQGYDEPAGPSISTHIKACQENPNLEIDWVCDIDEDHARTICRRWSLESDIASCDDAPRRSADIVCIASPDGTHGDWIRRFLVNPPKMILCEKPLSSDAHDAQRLISETQSAGSILVINFMRRWLPGVASWLAAARAGDFGPPSKACLTYCRGLRHNACHGLDLIGAVLEEKVISAVKAGDVFHDFSDDDPTVSAKVEIQFGPSPTPLILRGVDGRVQNEFDIDIIFDKSRLRILNDDGMRVQIFDDADMVVSEFHDNPARHMRYVWENLTEVLLNGAPLVFEAPESLPGSKLVDVIASAPTTTTSESILSPQ